MRRCDGARAARRKPHLRAGAGDRTIDSMSCPAVPLRALPAACRASTLVLVLATLPGLAAAQLSPVARQEIDGLLRAIGASNCEFLRGGTAYGAAKAQDHLQQKFDYLDTRGQLKTAEDFIAKAGTRSSMTGEPYGIRCAGTPTQSSEEWLHARLKALRQVSRRS